MDNLETHCAYPEDCVCEGLYLTKEETITIYNLLKYQYINYENTLALETVRKIGDWLNACQAGSTK